MTKKAKIVALVNQNGGVGKTTTAVNLAAGLAQLGQEVLVIDSDPQANATSGLGLDKRTVENTIYAALLNEGAAQDAVVETSTPHLSLIPANSALTGAEVELVASLARETRLRGALKPLRDRFDYILIDCPPSLGLITLNALTAAHSVLIPVQCEYYALEGLAQLTDTLERVRAALNPALEIEGAVLTMYDARISLANQVKAELAKHFASKFFETVIPRNIRLAEAPSFGKPVLAYDSESRGSAAYLSLAREFLARQSGFPAGAVVAEDQPDPLDEEEAAL